MVMPSEGNKVEDVLLLKEECKDMWRDKPDGYWFARLLEEVAELSDSLLGSYNDPPQHELKQIAAICLNWLERLEERGRG